MLPRIRCLLGKRSGELEVQEKSCVRVGPEWAQKKDFSRTSAQEDFTKNLKFLPTSPDLRAGREEPLSLDAAKMR